MSGSVLNLKLNLRNVVPYDPPTPRLPSILQQPHASGACAPQLPDHIDPKPPSLFPHKHIEQMPHLSKPHQNTGAFPALHPL
jgi:hypothetical protein